MFQIDNCSFIHSDFQQSPVYFVDGYKYCILFVDDYSQYSWIYTLKTKSSAFKTVLYFKKLLENLFNTTIKYLQSDGGKEYDNNMFFNYLVDNDIYFHKSALHTKQ